MDYETLRKQTKQAQANYFEAWVEEKQKKIQYLTEKGFSTETAIELLKLNVLESIEENQRNYY